MNDENQLLDQKSLRYVLDKQADADGLACDCVGFANAKGGLILLGIENGQDEPPSDQRVSDNLPEQLCKRITQITVNVGTYARKLTAANGGEFIELRIARNQQSIASTSDGRYFIRVSDETRRLMPDDLGRLLAEKNTLVWELQTTRHVPRDNIDRSKLERFIAQIQESDRVSPFIKSKSDGELLNHYFFTRGQYLTNLGILWVGRRDDRAALLYAPVIQCIKFDEREQKVRKQMWADYDLNPMEIIEAVWGEVPDWRESYELPDGLFRKSVPHYDEVVVRELMANALVHRPYTMRGDIFLNLYPDYLEVHNPGLLPIGVTPRNILHTTSKRNPHLAKVFYDLKLMEAEGSGFDRMYQILLSSGRSVPEVREGDDRVVVKVSKLITNPKIIDFMQKADQTFQITQKESITLGLLAQHESLIALQLEQLLELKNADELKHWIGRLKNLRVINSRGRTKATEYFVDPNLLRKLEFKGSTTLKGIEKHRLRELILRDLEVYKKASISQIHERIGVEIPRRKIQLQLKQLVQEGQIGRMGKLKHTVYLWTK